MSLLAQSIIFPLFKNGIEIALPTLLSREIVINMANSDVLSKDEMDTLLQNSDENQSGVGANLPPQDVNPYDFSQLSSKTINDLSKIETVHDILCEELSSRLSKFYCRKIDVEVSKPAIQPFGEYLQSLETPLLINVIDLKKLSSPGLVYFSKTFLNNSIEILFGGDVNNTSDENRLFARADHGISKLLTTLINKSLDNSWEEITTIDFQYVRSVSNIKMANIVEFHENALVTNCSFSVENNLCEFNICIPCSSLDPIKGIIEKRNKDSMTLEEQQEWRDGIKENVRNVSLELRCQISELKINLQELLKLKEDDVLYISNPKKAKIFVNGHLLYEGGCGTHNDNKAFKIQKVCCD